MGQILYTTVDMLFNLLMLLILARVILSWLPQFRYNQIGEMVYSLTEPILSPIQRVLPSTGMLDLSPMVAIFVLYILQQVFDTVIATIFSIY